MTWRAPFAAAISLLLIAATLRAGSIGGILYDDRNRNGHRDATELLLANVEVELYGNEGSVRRTTFTDTHGSYRFTNLSNGNYVVSARPGPGWRASLQDRGADPAPVPHFPFGRTRYASLPTLVDTLVSRVGVSDDYRHVALGDSIAFGFNFCGSFFGNHGYIEPVTERLREATAGHVITDKQAILGHATAQLLDPGIGPDSNVFENDVFYAIRQRAPLVSISIGGNDFLDAEAGGDAALAAAIVQARQNLQEILSALDTGMVDGETILNTVYDNLQGADALHNTWAPLWNQMLREQAWGQERRAAIAEIYPEYAHEEGGQILGQPGLICRFLGVDGIHPTGIGYQVHGEKLWQAMGGVTLHDDDRLDLDLGYVAMAGTRLPVATQDVTGQTWNDRFALAIDNVGALVPSADAEFRVNAFLGPAHPTQRPMDVTTSELAQAVLKVRYRTLGAPVDDYYVIEASVDGSFAAPGSTPSTWNTILPVVGSSGNDGAERLVFPYQPTWRTVAAPLYVGAPRDARTTLTWDDLKTLTVRVVTHAVNTPDAYAIELDAAWVEYTTMPQGTSYAGLAPDWRTTLPRLLATDRGRARDVLHRAIERGEVDAEVARSFGDVARDADAPVLRALARHRDPMVRAHALHALALHDATPADLAAAAADPDAQVRVVAAQGLAGLTPERRSTLLASLVRDPEARVRRAAILASGATEALLRDRLGDESAAVRSAAATVLLERGDSSGWSILCDALADAERPASILRAIAGAPDWIEPLVREAWRESSSPLARERLVAALGQRARVASATVDFLRSLVAASELGTRAAAIAALARVDADSAPAIAAVAGEPALRPAIARALEQLRDGRGFDVLADMALSDASATTRYLAARALGSQRDPSAIPRLLELERSPDEHVSQVARSAIESTR
jgi:HEAT repeat protein